ncbi:outer membrane biogenesis protein BamB [Thalassoglobus neptunius]|uniref:Outer membrane biogenesis protein BamB n=1 Tax=Thalassoglobus neptunius TaxID=1938619 RepID=A0A5C5X532_9PLAN|nr:PQQ-binding-like beta-propeller repeat protein [Thalassoglobus neptunius]TWT57431.1 outer membrane biogenesis protein BamB [Thalassoglobus neptunius]
MDNPFSTRRLAVLLTFFLICELDTFAGDWPQWRGPMRNGHSAAELPVGSELTLPTVWETSVGTGMSSMVVVENRLVTIGNVDDQDIVQCLNATTGDSLWQHRYPEPLDPNLFEGGPTSTPLIVDSTVYTISRRGKIFALGLENGLVQWEFDVVDELELNVPTWGFSGSPLHYGETVIFNVGSNGLCLNREDGQIVWKSSNDEDAGYTSPTIFESGENVYCLIVSGKTFNIVRPDSGDVVASERWITRYGINAADPIVLDEEHIFLSSGYGKGTALFQFKGEELTQLWRNRDLRIQMSPGVLVDGSVFGIDGDAGNEAALVCMNPMTGDVHWKHPLPGPASLLVAENAIGMLGESGLWTQFEASPKSFEPLGATEVNSTRCWTPPILANDRLYTRNAAGRIVCSDVQVSARESQ